LSVETVNDNSSIIYFLILLSPILSANVCIIVYLDLLCAASTHLHGIRFDGLLRKSYTKKNLQVQKIEDNKKMDYLPEILLTPHNYLEWKPKIILILICRFLYQITMEMEVEPDSVDEKNDFLNRQDMAIGCILYFISTEVLHQVYDDSQEFTPNDLWRRLEVLFWNKE
jgi:hypothetical protein